MAHCKSVLSLFPPWTRQRENNLFFSTAWKLPRTNRGRGKPLQSGPDTRFPAAVSRERQINRDAVSQPSLLGTGAGTQGAGSDPSFQPGPDWVGSRRQTSGRDSTGSDTQKVAQDGKVTGRVGGAGPHGTSPLCRLGFHAERSSPDLQAHPNSTLTADSLPEGGVLSRAHRVFREGSQPAWGSV